MSEIDFGERFRWLHDQYRKPDGSKWKNTEIEQATGGLVSANYITNLKGSRLANPSYERLQAIARAMGFPPHLWHAEAPDIFSGYEPGTTPADAPLLVTLADKLNFLFEVRLDPDTNQPVTEERVARLSRGRLTAEALSAARRGEVEDLSTDQYFALCNAFGVEMSYWYRTPTDLPQLDPQTVVSLRDPEAEEVLNKYHAIERKEDRDLIRNLLDRFLRQRNNQND